MPKLGKRIIGRSETTPSGRALFVQSVTSKAIMPSRAETLKEAPRYTLAKIAAIMPKIRAMPTPRMIFIVRSSLGANSDSRI